MVRYFMTIPEAVQLVIQAGALGVHGETFLLDMGEPVRILDLAKDLIRLSGFVPGEEIPIQFTGIRPGEKLFEELLTAEEGVTATQHERILVAPPSRHDPLQLDRQVEELIALAEAGRVEAVRMKLAEIVPDFHLRRGDPATSASRGDGRPPGSAPGGETAQETGRGGEKTRAPSPPGADRRLAPSQKGLVL
jgi:FlaA1/EpsC-like NDP-sugar epimerase